MGVTYILTFSWNFCFSTDGTHVPVEPPKDDKPDFWNRKNTTSINVLIISGKDYKINYISSRAPGSHHDSSIFKKTHLYRWLDNGWYVPFQNAILLADSAYEVSFFDIIWQFQHVFLLDINWT